MSHAHVDAFTVGAIAALKDAGFTQREITDSDAVTKVDVAPATYGKVGKIATTRSRPCMERSAR